MPWESGFYFSKSDDDNSKNFLKSQGLNDDQIESVNRWHKLRIVGQVSQWSGATMILGMAAGVGIAWVFNIGGCVLF